MSSGLKFEFKILLLFMWANCVGGEIEPFKKESKIDIQQNLLYKLHKNAIMSRTLQ